MSNVYTSQSTKIVFASAKYLKVRRSQNVDYRSKFSSFFWANKSGMLSVREAFCEKDLWNIFNDFIIKEDYQVRGDNPLPEQKLKNKLFTGASRIISVVINSSDQKQ